MTKRFITIILLTVFICIPLNAQTKEEKPKVTFIELGSVNCIPCKMMQPVMEAIEKKYGDQVKVVFMMYGHRNRKSMHSNTK